MLQGKRNNQRRKRKPQPKASKRKVKTPTTPSTMQSGKRYFPKTRPERQWTLVRLTECAQKYAVALTDAWAPEALSACIPTAPALASHKARAQIRFDGAIGLQGIGFVALMHSSSKDAPHGYYTDATFNSSLVLTYAAVAGLVPVYLAGLPYTFGEVNPNVNCFPRIVASAIRLEYVGTTLNESGLTYALHEPNHEALNNASGSTLGQYPATVVQRVGDRSIAVLNGFPINSLETAYTDNLAPYPWCKGVNSGAFPVNGTFPGGAAGTVVSVVMITGVPGQTFHVELCQHMEYIGFNTTAMQTPTHSDAAGFSSVIQAVQQIPLKLSQEPDCPPICQLRSSLTQVMKEMIPQVLDKIVGPASSRANQSAAQSARRLF